MHLQAQLRQGLAQLRQGHAGVVHQQHLTPPRTLQQRIGQAVAGYLGVVGHDLGQHLFHVDDFHQLLFDLGDRRQVMLAPRATRWRQDGLPVEVENAIDAAHQERLHRAVVLGNDDGAALIRHYRAHADGLRQVDDRQGLATQIDHPANEAMAMRHQRQLGHLQDFLHLEHVDREQLSPSQAEHQNFQAVLAHQLGTLIHRVENASHCALQIVVIESSYSKAIGKERQR